MTKEFAGFTDIHAHFLYGLDDGAKDRHEMEAMLDAADADGILSLFATPHVTPGIEPFDRALYRGRLEEAQRYCHRKGYALRLYSGAEILYTPALEQYALNHRLPTLAESDHVLVEFVPDVSYRELEAAVAYLERGGYIPVLAHVERYRCLYSGKHAVSLKERRNVRYQMNASTVLSSGGFFHRRILQGWFRCGLVDFVASDAHDCNHRSFLIRKAYGALERLYGRSEAMKLTGLA